jgi:uncharacterized protein YjbI with pentapeptide repeats
MNSLKYSKHLSAKKKILVASILLLALLLIVASFNRALIKSYISELVASPTLRPYILKTAKVAIPIKNFIMMRNGDDKIELLKSSGSCSFCNLSKLNFNGADLTGVNLRYANLNGADLSGVNLTSASLLEVSLKEANLQAAILEDTRFFNTNFSGADLSKTDLSRRNLKRSNFSGVNFSDTNFTGSILIGVNLSDAIISGAVFIKSDLSGANLDGVDLRYKDLTGVNLSGVDLRNKDLTGTILIQSNLSGANLDGVDLRYKDLTGVNLSGVDLRNKDLTGTNLKDAKKIEISIKNLNDFHWLASKEIQNLNTTRYDLRGDEKFIATREGNIFKSIKNDSNIILDMETDVLDIASQNDLVYISYQEGTDDGSNRVVVDEYSMNFNKIRNIIKIGGMGTTHFGGKLFFDSFGQLYLSVGDGEPFPAQSKAQSLNSLTGKILRLDVSSSKREPEILAYGIRSPWGVTIDSRDRIFVSQCGNANVEAVYILEDIYSGIPANFGWPIYEGSVKVGWDLFEGNVEKNQKQLLLSDVLTPIFQYNSRPGCATAGVFLDEIQSFLIGDFYGSIRLLKQKENGDWYLFHENKKNEFWPIWGFGVDDKTKKIYMAPNNLEIEISVKEVKFTQ